MTNQERYQYYNSGQLQPMVQIELIDWLAYWTSIGTDIITDPLLKEQTNEAIKNLLYDLNGMTNKVSMMAIGEAVIKDAPLLPTEENVKTAVTTIMSTRLRWLTGVDAVETGE